MTFWQEVAEEGNDYYLVLRDADHYYEARIKYDGCFEFVRAHNEPLPELPEPTSQMIDQIHICDVDDMIARLQELKRLAFVKFGSELWGDEKAGLT